MKAKRKVEGETASEALPFKYPGRLDPPFEILPIEMAKGAVIKLDTACDHERISGTTTLARIAASAGGIVLFCSNSELFVNPFLFKAAVHAARQAGAIQ